MKKALIHTEATYSTGFRVQEVQDSEFEVAPPNWYWVDCPDDVDADRHWYNPSDSSFAVMPEVAAEEAEVAAWVDDPNADTPPE